MTTFKVYINISFFLIMNLPFKVNCANVKGAYVISKSSSNKITLLNLLQNFICQIKTCVAYFDIISNSFHLCSVTKLRYVKYQQIFICQLHIHNINLNYSFLFSSVICVEGESSEVTSNSLLLHLQQHKLNNLNSF